MPPGEHAGGRVAGSRQDRVSAPYRGAPRSSWQPAGQDYFQGREVERVGVGALPGLPGGGSVCRQRVSTAGAGPRQQVTEGLRPRAKGNPILRPLFCLLRSQIWGKELKTR